MSHFWRLLRHPPQTLHIYAPNTPQTAHIAALQRLLPAANFSGVGVAPAASSWAYNPQIPVLQAEANALPGQVAAFERQLSAANMLDAAFGASEDGADLPVTLEVAIGQWARSMMQLLTSSSQYMGEVSQNLEVLHSDCVHVNLGACVLLAADAEVCQVIGCAQHLASGTESGLLQSHLHGA